MLRDSRGFDDWRGLARALPNLLRWLWIAPRHLPVSGTLRQMGLALRDALSDTELIRTGPSGLEVSTRETEPGCWVVSLNGGTFYEESLFADCLAELLGPVENPRYLVTRRGRGLWRRRVDYHAVPAPLAGKKARASLFASVWRRRVGPSELVYTRSREGRATLLRARGRALSAAFADPTRRRDRWQ